MGKSTAQNITGADNTTDNTSSRGRVYVWMVLAPLIVVVAACILTIIIAVDTGDRELPIDLTRTGKALDHSPQQKMALESFAKASARFDLDAGRVTIMGASLGPEITALKLQLVHPTLAREDVSVELSRSSGEFTGELPARFPIRGRLLLQPSSESWVIGTQYELTTSRTVDVRFADQ